VRGGAAQAATLQNGVTHCRHCRTIYSHFPSNRTKTLRSRILRGKASPRPRYATTTVTAIAIKTFVSDPPFGSDSPPIKNMLAIHIGTPKHHFNAIAARFAERDKQLIPFPTASRSPKENMKNNPHMQPIAIDTRESETMPTPEIIAPCPKTYEPGKSPPTPVGRAEDNPSCAAPPAAAP
jgi:hypothetical protein